MDEIFEAENNISVVAYRTSSPLGAGGLLSVCDYLLWYAKEKPAMKFRQLITAKGVGECKEYTWKPMGHSTYRISIVRFEHSKPG